MRPAVTLPASGPAARPPSAPYLPSAPWVAILLQAPPFAPQGPRPSSAKVRGMAPATAWTVWRESEGALGLCVGGHLPPIIFSLQGPPSAPSLSHTQGLSRPLSRAPRSPCPAFGMNRRELTADTASGGPCLAPQLSRLWVHAETPAQPHAGTMGRVRDGSSVRSRDRVPGAWASLGLNHLSQLHRPRERQLWGQTEGSEPTTSAVRFWFSRKALGSPRVAAWLSTTLARGPAHLPS